MKESTFFHRYKEILLGVFMIALASFYLYNAAFIRTRSSVSVSAKLIPEILGCLAIGLGILQIIAGIKYLLEVRRHNRESGIVESFMSAGGLGNAIPVVITFIIILLYAVAFEPLGFVISSTLCMFAMMWVLSPKSKFRPVPFALISLLSAFVIYIAFRKGLDLSLPGGLLEGVPYL